MKAPMTLLLWQLIDHQLLLYVSHAILRWHSNCDTLCVNIPISMASVEQDIKTTILQYTCLQWNKTTTSVPIRCIKYWATIVVGYVIPTIDWISGGYIVLFLDPLYVQKDLECDYSWQNYKSSAN